MTTTATPTAIGMVGILTDDPELRTSKSGKPWLRCRISVRPFVPGVGELPVEFCDIVAFGSLAENVASVAHKGDRVVVTGRAEEEQWTGTDGVERVTMKVIAEGFGLDLRFGSERAGTKLDGRGRTGDVQEGMAIPNEPDYEEPY
jgi:single stranded DNA-binding protein